MDNSTKTHFYVDEHRVRIIAFQVIIFTALSLVFKSYWLALALAADFSLRAFTYYSSPLIVSAKVFSYWVKLPPKPVFARPKKFAALLGFIFSVIIAAFLYLGYNNSAYGVGLILVFCAGLESFLNICLGCYAYNWLVVPVNNHMNKR